MGPTKSKGKKEKKKREKKKRKKEKEIWVMQQADPWKATMRIGEDPG